MTDHLQHAWRDPPAPGTYIVNLCRDHAEMVERLRKACRLDTVLAEAIERLDADERSALLDRHQLIFDTEQQARIEAAARALNQSLEATR